MAFGSTNSPGFSPSGGDGIKIWAANTSYAVNDFVYHDGKLYHVDTTFTSGTTFSDTNLTPICKGGGWENWATATDYEVGDYVVHGTQIYRCLTAHTSDVWATDIANWEIISGTPIWTAGETYIEGEIIYYDKALYHVDSTFTAGSIFEDTNLTILGGAGGGAKLADVDSATATAAPNKVTLTWTDPSNVVIDGATVAEWAGTRVVRKAGTAPLNKNDGDIVVDSVVRDEYSVTGFVDTNIVNGTTYYYRWFPYTTSEAYTTGTVKSATPNLLDANLTLNNHVVIIGNTPTSATTTVTATRTGTGAITVTSSDDTIATASVAGNTITVTYVATGTATITVNLAAQGDYASDTDTITVRARTAIRVGYKIEEAESDPYARVTYLYDAVGMTPASMDFINGVFNYGSWQNVWFVADNKPCMLKNDGTVDYYLDPDNYEYKEDGVTLSDVSNTSYEGNAMSEIPACWVYRYEDADYKYEIISNVKYDSNYEAYAHTRADGTIADVFYWSMFGGSGDSSKIRSLAGQTLAQSLTAVQEIAGAQANGSLWYTHSWSQHELIRTLCVLMGKSTDTQAVFGNGNCRSATSASGMLSTGTLKSSGQFFGYNTNSGQVKVFHIEKFWGDQWDRIAGLINNYGTIYVKMTPEGTGYRVTDVSGYTNTGSAPGGNDAYISGVNMSGNGAIPSAVSGSSTTYYPDGYLTNNSQLGYLLVGVSANFAVAFGGGFAFAVNGAPSDAVWVIGCGLTCEKPA